jgi:hypothetical protein
MGAKLSEEEDEQTRLLREILKWIRFSGLREVKSVLTSVLDDPQKLLAYHLSDGSRGTIEIGEATGIRSTATITRYWQTWKQLGLGESISVRGGDRFRRLFDLTDFGIVVPESNEVRQVK